VLAVRLTVGCGALDAFTATAGAALTVGVAAGSSVGAGVGVRAADGARSVGWAAGVGAGDLAATVFERVKALLLPGGVTTDGNWLCTTVGCDLVGCGRGRGTPGVPVCGGVIGAPGGFTAGGLG
jgi:hypothetical protein